MSFGFAGLEVVKNLDTSFICFVFVFFKRLFYFPYSASVRSLSGLDRKSMMGLMGWASSPKMTQERYLMREIELLYNNINYIFSPYIFFTVFQFGS